jgi:hypothetical protein
MFVGKVSQVIFLFGLNCFDLTVQKALTTNNHKLPQITTNKKLPPNE